jgi:hypothetical protein
VKRTILGIVLATIVLYFWGFLYWGLNPLPYQALRRSTDTAAAGEALRKFFPENGTYLFPAMYADEAEAEKMYSAGPVGILQMTSVDGRPAFDPRIMLNGFLVNTIVVCLIAVVLRTAITALPTYGSRVKFAALIGLACAFLADIGEVAWWDVGLAWNVHKAIYTVSAWVVTALVLAKFVGESRNAGS